MAQTYTLEEAAGRLALPPEEFKRRLKDDWKQIRSFRDGATLRFRAADIDELARMLGQASDPDLQLGPVGGVAAAHDSDDFLLSPESPSGAAPLSGLIRPSDLSSSADFVLPSPESSSPKVGKPKPNLKPPSDSDIKIEAADRSRPDSEHSLPTEEIALDLSGPGSAIIRPSGLSGKLTPPKSSTKLPPPKPSGKISGPPSGKLTSPAPSKISGPPSGKLTSPATGRYSGPPSAKIPGPGSGNINPVDASSEFELSLDADSDSFELQLGGNDDHSMDMDLQGLELGPPGADHGGLSGIDLGKPADSGLSLEKGTGSKPKGTPLGGPHSSKILPRSGGGKSGGKSAPLADESDVDFELAIDTGRGSGPKGTSSVDSDSEFELTLDDDAPTGIVLGDAPKTAAGSATAGRGDILETDFELPAVDGDEDGDAGTEALSFDEGTDENSDFDLAISDADVQVDEESESQVVLVDDAPLIDEDGNEVLVEEGADALAGVEVEDSPSASAVMRDVDRDEDEDDFAPVRTVPAAPAQWGALPAAILLPSLLFVFLGGLMSFELLRGMWGYHQPGKPSSMLLRGMADTFGMKVND